MTEIRLGWIEPKDRTDEGHQAHAAAMGRMPVFAMPSAGGTPPVGTKLLLTDLWQHPKVIEALGGPYTGSHQISGSCVWAGGQNAGTTVSFIDVLKNNELEKLIVPYFLANYGPSRIAGGLRGEGEGSFGSTFAESCKDDGTPDSRLPELKLPQPKTNDGWIWGESVEMHWSDARNVPNDVAAEGKKHVIRTTTPLTDGASVRDAILNGYPVTRAFGTFVNPGTASIRNGALIGSYNGRGGHQESWLGYWNHPQEGELIWEQNQWGLAVYGKDPGGGPAGGCWIRMSEVDRMCKARDSEIFAFSQYEGYPGQPDVYDWVNNSFWS